jgi:hypothetical protein
LDPKGAKTLIEGMGQKNKGFYEGGGRRCALYDIQWPLHETMSYNSKGYMNITYFREKVHMSNII